MDIYFSTTKEETRRLLEDYKYSLSNELSAVERLITEDFTAEDVLKLENTLTSKAWLANYNIMQSINVDESFFYGYPEELIDFNLIAEGNTYHIIFNKLIPKNPAIYDKLSIWISNKNRIVSAYRKALLKATKGITIKPFTDKVMVLFVHHYLSNKQLPDLDNFSTKIFIDTVLTGGGFVIDDAADCINQLSIVYSDDIENFTEVFIGPSFDVLRIIERFI